MATVPTYGDQKVNRNVGNTGSVIQQRAAPTAAFGAQRSVAPVAAFGVPERNPGAVGQAVSQLGNVFNAMAEQARKVRAEENLLAYQKERNDILMNPETGYYNKSGKEAYEAREATYKQLEDLNKQRADKIEDPVSRELYTRATQSLLLQDQQQTMEHAARNFKLWENAVDQQRLENSFLDASRDWSNPEQLAIDFEAGKQAIVNMNVSNGMGTDEYDEYIREEVNQYAGKFYGAAVEAAINNSVSDGEMLLEKYDGYLDATDEWKLREKLRVRQDAEQKQAYATLAITKATNLVSDFGDMPDAGLRIIAAVNEIDDPLLRDLTMGQAMQNLNQYQAAKQEESAAIYESAVALMVDPQNPMTTAQIISMNPQAWNKLTGVQQAALLSAEERGPVKTNLELWTGLTNATDAEIKAITNEELSELQTQLSVDDYKKLVTHRKDLLAGTEATRVGWTMNAQATSVLKELFGNKKGEVEEDEKLAFYAMMNAEYEQAVAKKGAELTYKETQDLFDSFAAEVAVTRDGWWMGEYQTTMTIDEVPPNAILEITRDLQNNGLEVDVQTIITTYEANKDKF